MNPGSISLIGMPVLAIAAALAVAGLFRWRLGFLGLLIFLPFAGIVSLTFFPNNIAKLTKDLLFVIPLYAVLLVHLDEFRKVRVPAIILFCLSMIAVLVLVQTMNPSVPSLGVALVGVKVWLLYLPLLFVTGAYLRDISDLHRLLRTLTVVAAIPCAFGLLQYLQIESSSLRTVMVGYYGAAAPAVTQRFTNMEFGGITIYRIPATFPFFFQYFGFIIASMVPAYSVWRSDPDKIWRGIGGAIFLLIVIAGFLSGSRLAFVFVPTLVALFLVLEGRATTLLIVGPLLLLGLFLLMLVLGLEPIEIYRRTVDRLGSDSLQRPTIDALFAALNNFPLGHGAGMNTLAARHIVPDGSELIIYETFYGKTAHELGALGLALWIVMLLSSIFAVVGVVKQTMPGTLPRHFASAVLAFVLVMVVDSVKAERLDLDPVNIYFWVYLGIVFRIPGLQRGVATPSPFISNYDVRYS